MGENRSEFEGQYKEISGWLGEVFDGQSLPNYEINQQTLSAISKIMLLNKEEDMRNNIIIDDIRRKRKEYEMKAHLLTKQLKDIGMSTSSLSQAGHRHLKTMSMTAVLLKLKDCRYSSYALAMTDVSNKAEGHSSEILRQEKDRIHLKRQMAGVEERMQSLKSSFDMLNLQSVTEQPLLERQQKEKQFLQMKMKEYQDIIKDLEESTRKNGFNMRLCHSTLQALYKEYLDLCDEIGKVKSSLLCFHNLPPDMSLARVKIAEAYHELQSLEMDLNNGFEVLNL